VCWAKMATTDNILLRRGTPAEAGLDPLRLNSVWELLEGWTREGLVPTATIAVAREGVQLETRAFGSASRNGLPALRAGWSFSCGIGDEARNRDRSDAAR